MVYYPPQSAVVLSAPATVSGVSTKQTLLAGQIVPAGGFAAGQIYRVSAWGVLTTAVITDTFTFELDLGGSQLSTFGAQNPSSGGLISNAVWTFEGELTLQSQTSITGWIEDALNFFPSAVTDFGPTTIPTTAQQFALAVTPSDASSAITIRGGYCMRLA
jgi:hypothetical protein